jgi:glycine betaine/proline transport system substrate-binding protein
MKKLIGIVLAMFLVIGILSGCGGMKNNEESKGKVNLSYVSWSDSVMVTHLAAAVLEDKMGYDVELNLADIAPVLASVAGGSSDAYLDVWLPYTHVEYMEKYSDDMEPLGVLFEGPRNGLVVPSYVDINSIEELNANKDLFRGEIVGIDPGAGLMVLTEAAVEEYGLDYKLQSGSATTMTAALDKAIDSNEPIVVTGWAPHWKFIRWDLKFLEDPQNVYGKNENAYKYSRKGLEEDMPEVTAFLKNFTLSLDDVAELMDAFEKVNGENPMDVARTWISENEELVNTWIPEV